MEGHACWVHASVMKEEMAHIAKMVKWLTELLVCIHDAMFFHNYSVSPA